MSFLGAPYILKDGHILESLASIECSKLYAVPSYDLTILDDKVKEIKLPKPIGKIFWI